jgi:transcription elongation factor GreA
VQIEEQVRVLKNRVKKLVDQMDDVSLGTSTMENIEFYEMKSEKFFMEEKISKLEDILDKAEIASHKSGEIDIGCRVKISNHKICHILNIVEGIEADSSKGKVSNQSPFGQALVGKKVGDQVKVKTPGGEIPFEVVAIH